MFSLDALERAETGESFNRIKRGEATDAAMKLLNLSVSLDDGTAVLTDTSTQAYADGILAALNDPVRAAAIGAAAQRLAATKYSYDAYLERTRRACSALVAPTGPTAVAKDLA